MQKFRRRFRFHPNTIKVDVRIFHKFHCVGILARLKTRVLFVKSTSVLLVRQKSGIMVSNRLYCEKGPNTRTRSWIVLRAQQWRHKSLQHADSHDCACWCRLVFTASLFSYSDTCKFSEFNFRICYNSEAATAARGSLHFETDTWSVRRQESRLLEIAGGMFWKTIIKASRQDTISRKQKDYGDSKCEPFTWMWNISCFFIWTLTWKHKVFLSLLTELRPFANTCVFPFPRNCPLKRRYYSVWFGIKRSCLFLDLKISITFIEDPSLPGLTLIIMHQARWDKIRRVWFFFCCFFYARAFIWRISSDRHQDVPRPYCTSAAITAEKKLLMISGSREASLTESKESDPSQEHFVSSYLEREPMKSTEMFSFQCWAQKLLLMFLRQKHSLAT